jgi:transposase-like protein
MSNTENKSKFNNLLQLMQEFSNEDLCLEYLKKMRWADGAYCPHCGDKKVYAFSDGKRFKCSSCRKQFTAKVGSIFDNTKIPLQKWFVAIYLISSHKKGISSIQLSKDLGITQKSAWFILHRLRFASQTKAFNAPLKNIVEADESYIGGKEKNKHKNKKTENTQGRSTATKTPILAVVERKGNIIAKKSNSVDGKAIGKFITNNVVLGSKLMTDEYRIYKQIQWLYKHNFVKHGDGEYVQGDCHTNTVEGFFSLLKRGIIGIYHFVSAKHLDSY